MNPITEFKQSYQNLQQAYDKMRLKFPLSSLPKFFLVYNNTILSEKYLYAHYSYELGTQFFTPQEAKSSAALSLFIKQNIYPDFKFNNSTNNTFTITDYYFPLSTASFFRFQFTYSDLPFVKFNRLFRLLMYICVNCYRVNAGFYCGVKQFTEVLGYDKENLIKMLSKLEADKWIKCESIGNNLKNQPSSYKINIDLIDFNFFCKRNLVNSNRNLSNFCFKEE